MSHMSDEPLFANLDDTDPAMVAALSEAKDLLRYAINLGTNTVK